MVPLQMTRFSERKGVGDSTGVPARARSPFRKARRLVIPAPFAGADVPRVTSEENERALWGPFAVVVLTDLDSRPRRGRAAPATRPDAPLTRRALPHFKPQLAYLPPE